MLTQPHGVVKYAAQTCIRCSRQMSEY